MDPTLKQCGRCFECDGSLRDVIISEVTLGDWQIAIDAVRRSADSVWFGYGNEVAPLPDRVGDVFKDRGPGSDRPTFRARYGELLFNCHFFRREIIEFDLDPSEVKTEAD